MDPRFEILMFKLVYAEYFMMFGHSVRENFVYYIFTADEISVKCTGKTNFPNAITRAMTVQTL
jgi:hypothetical protein